MRLLLRRRPRYLRSMTQRSVSRRHCASRWKPIARIPRVLRATHEWTRSGFGLENFDAIGSWRTEDGKFPVDASGSLPGADPLAARRNSRRCSRKIATHLSTGLTEKLLTYALGRGLERFDRPVVASITAKLPSQNYRFSATRYWR